MISGLRGVIKRFGASTVYLDVNGVEYEVYIPLNVFSKLQHSPGGEEVSLHIYHHFMENDQRLYGFSQIEQRELFSAIRAIKGIGTVLALSLLSHLDGPRLLELCETKDLKSLCRIPRVGKSTAETLVFEINRRLERWQTIITETSDGAKKGASKSSNLNEQEELAFTALVQLGYREKEALEALEKLTSVDDYAPMPAADLIKESLRLL